MMKVPVFLPIFMLAADAASGQLPPGKAGPRQQAPAERRAERYSPERDLKRLNAFSGQLNELAGEMELLHRTVKREERGYYSSDEHDRIESLLFRYLACRDSLWDLINYYEGCREALDDVQIDAKGCLIGFGAAANLVFYSSKMVNTFLDSPAVRKKLNEKFYRSGIERGSFDRIFRSVTSIDNIRRYRTAWELLQNEIRDEASVLAGLMEFSKDYRKLFGQIEELHERGEKLVNSILERSSLYSPSVRNRLRHSALTEYALVMKTKLGDNVSAARAVLFVNVSRLRSPRARVIKMTDEQITELHRIMNPGDLIVTFSDGYMSNIFLPGTFKHGITYVGLPVQRRECGLTEEVFADIPSQSARQRARADLKREDLPNGMDADLIEAVAEGVVFSSLAEITDMHLSRMLVLRPKITSGEKLEQLKTVFQLLGNSYDFTFNFEDGSCQCCTEVIYRSLNKKGSVDFRLTKRMGSMTLSADDIVSHHLDPESDAFEFVLLVEGRGKKNSPDAVILTGNKGEKRLRELMGLYSRIKR